MVLFAAWLAYYVPLRVGMRQQVADARTADRFSGGLRVLAVAGRKGPDVALAAEGPVVTGGVPLLAMSVHETRGIRGREEAGDMSVDESQGDTEPRRALGPAPAARSDARRAAARRRMLLTLALVAATALVGVLAGFGALPWPVLLVPVVLLAGVLALGRRAVVAARRADQARLDAARRRALDARRQALGSPLAPRNTARGDRRRVTGHAVQASQTATQMIPRITAEDIDRARRAAARRSHRSERPTAQGPSTTPAPERSVSGPEADPTAREESSTWEPVPVPPPTYTMKPTAGTPPRPPLPEPLPEPTPAPVSAEELAPMAAPGRVRVPAELRTGRAAEAAESASDGTSSSQEAPAPVPAAGDEPRPTTETLGLSLDAILARRRAVGE
ncbi:hypothetical protein GCM10023221_11760 [Luteimicrobium xylanilyticum]|uniref:DNA-directed DNA polymerase n=1 Tax=Luteimicrobium xylanilyticum TaxID=1133546 RepID=A0A5P9QD04_9MICO|nr:DNA-directed DNA polymerase [Luteimicrobium xylanilyticum]